MFGVLKEICKDAPHGKPLLGMDVGTKTIGLALSTAQWNIVTPLETLKRTKFMRDMEDVRKIIGDYDVGGVVVGYPLNMDGSAGPSAQRVRDFVMEMDRFFEGGIWVALHDERLSTDAVHDLVDNSVNKKSVRHGAKSAGLVDQLAAKVILEDGIQILKQSV